MRDGTKTDINIGLSGSELKIISGKIIRKYCPNSNFVNRFKIQIDKQIQFNNLNKNENLFTPSVIDYNLEYFDMQYIPGESYKEFFSKCTKQDLDLIVDSYSTYIKNLLSNSEYWETLEVKNKILTKLQSLKFKSKYKDYIFFLERSCNKIDFERIPKTLCHGDFSVANMIFFKGKVCCIDFLDSFIDTVIVDLVKLQQDLKYGWILDINNSSLRVRQSFKYLWDKVYLQFYKYYDLEFTKIITILNWLRIEPYLKTKKQKLTLDKFITNSNYYEEFNNSNSR